MEFLRTTGGPNVTTVSSNCVIWTDGNALPVVVAVGTARSSNQQVPVDPQRAGLLLIFRECRRQAPDLYRSGLRRLLPDYRPFAQSFVFGIPKPCHSTLRCTLGPVKEAQYLVLEPPMIFLEYQSMSPKRSNRVIFSALCA